MKRGEIWTVAGGKDYAGKPRPVVILQDGRFDKTDSITVCAFKYMVRLNRAALVFLGVAAPRDQE